ncbi:MAG: photosystem II biogenesis protein Psp29 [Symploca sp. SIO2E6]|nr:photosystem II biogenesis protein Psp29 [Symploca sp. SIO2E6]
MNKVRTVSDTKRDFYNQHTRPVNSIYRRFVEELMVEMHLLSVNVDFRYDPIYALGVATSFDRFMQGYRPSQDQKSIFNALCQSMGQEAQQYHKDAELLRGLSVGKSTDELISWFSSPTPLDTAGDFHTTVAVIADNPNFKYNRLFAIGLYTLLEQTDSELVKDEKQLTEALKQIAQVLNLPEEKLQKDLELYRSNLEKMAQAQSVIKDVIKAERKKRQQRAQAQAPGATESTEDSDESQDETSSSDA